MLRSIDCFFSIGKKNSFLSSNLIKCFNKEEISDFVDILMFFPFYYVLLKNIETDFGFKNIRTFYFIFTISTIFILVLNSGSSEISTIMFNNLHPEDKVIFKDYSVDAIRAIGWSLKRALILPIRIWLSGNAFYWLYVLFLIAFTNYIILFNIT